ncbi:MAG: DNA translocase FtsK 4TM domain-containing protein [Desulfotomaculales bacterium]
MPKTQRADRRLELAGIATVTLALFGLASLFTTSVGTAGNLFRQGLLLVAGEGRYLLPPVFIFIGLKMIRARQKPEFTPRLFGLFLILVLILTFLHLSFPFEEAFNAGKQGLGGGLLGALCSSFLLRFFGPVGSYIILTSLLIVALILFTELSLAQLGQFWGGRLLLAGQKIKSGIEDFIFEEVEDEDESEAKEQNGKKKPRERLDKNKKVVINKPEEKSSFAGGLDREEQPSSKTKELKIVQPPVNPPSSEKGGKRYQLPPPTLLSPVKAKGEGATDKEINEKIGILEETLTSFGIPARVTQVTVGPAITRYEIQPPAGVKVSRIVGLADDLALALAAPQVRIEAPIPGRAAIGIEVPNRKIATVHLRELLESKEFQQSPSRLTVALGKDIAGAPVIADLAQMPHLLVAGATGSGKSVCINTIVASILFKATPEEVKFILIDPKMVELITYNGIPHLITPVVTSPKKAAGILHWAVKEMERRYELFAAAGARDIARYNELYAVLPASPASKNAGEERKETGETRSAGEKGATSEGTASQCANGGGAGDGPLPSIVIIIDELADLMMVAPAEVEDSICRLAQMARAAGLHLVVATQRPSVDIITGLIKANIPSRISFAVSSQMDSRTILDIGGAEKLLGKGDMLYFPVGAPKPVRVQGTFLSDREVEALVTFLKEQAKPAYDQEVAEMELPENSSAQSGEEDELLPQAVQLFIEKGTASISLLQRRFHIGYARAARLVDIMEQRGIVGKFDGSKPRQVLMTLEQFKRTFQNKEVS